VRDGADVRLRSDMLECAVMPGLDDLRRNADMPERDLCRVSDLRRVRDVCLDAGLHR